MGVVKSAQCDTCGDIITKSNPGVAVRGDIHRVDMNNDKGYECWGFINHKASYSPISADENATFICTKCLINKINKIGPEDY